ncbi:hypothetical protein C8R43DRAFT_1006142 [Mycena crocata]|nr:hypothetical protein C8R43DRAFT_1006142 [Mycena crocata]
MHPALSLGNLRLLPTSYRRSASAAADGSFDELMYLVGEAKERPESLSKLFLPVFYAQLVPTKARHLESEEIVSPADAKLVILAFVAIQGLSVIQGMPPATFSDVWPGLWRWSQLIMKHDYCLPSYHGYHPSEVYITILGVIEFMRRAETPAKSTIQAEPGVRVLVAKVWALLSRPDHWVSGIRSSGYTGVFNMLRQAMDISNMRHHEDLVEGAGGTLAHLALLVVNFITHVPSQDRKKSVFFLNNALAFIDQTERLRPEFTTCLMAQGIVRALSIALSDLSVRDGPIDQDSMDNCFRMLVMKMFNPPGYQWVAEALDAGFLKIIVSSLARIRLVTADRLEEAMTLILGRNTTYNSVLSRLRVSLAKIPLVDRKLVNILPAWKELSTLVHGRIELLKYYESEEYVAMKACDNPQCGKISTKSDFKSCSGCRSVSYCSAECQRADWRRGHRSSCRDIRLHWLTDPDYISARDKSFLRAVLHHEYTTRLKDILLRQLLFANQSPGTPFCVMFDYTADGETTIVCVPIATPSLAKLLGPSWHDAVSRAAASGGRMQLHLMGVAEGSVKRWRIVPLRTRTPALMEEVLVLGRDLPIGTTDEELKENLPRVLEERERLIAEHPTDGDIHG